MSDFVCINWRPRRESLDECTTRAEAFFKGLARCDPELTRWYRLGRSRKDALSRPVTPNGETLRKLLAAGRNRTDFGRQIIEDLGYYLSLWNGGANGEAFGTRIHCGCYSPTGGNSCTVELPQKGPPAERILCTPAMIQILLVMVEAWEPDYGVAASFSYFNIRPEANERHPPVGWLVYVSNRLGRVPLVPAPATLTPVGTKGALIITTPERFSENNQAHLAAADGVLTALEAAGLRRSAGESWD